MAAGFFPGLLGARNMPGGLLGLPDANAAPQAPQGLLAGLMGPGPHPFMDAIGSRSAALMGFGLPLLLSHWEKDAMPAAMAGLQGGQQMDFARGQAKEKRDREAQQQAALDKLYAQYGIPAGTPESIGGPVLAAQMKPPDVPTSVQEFQYGQSHPDFAAWQDRNRPAGSRPTPYTDPGKLASDLAAGLITREQYDQAMRAGPGVNFDDEAKLRGEYLKGSGDFMSVRDSYSRLEAAAKDKTGASDIAMVYAYMKMLDPGSVVREGEFATAEQAGGVPAQIINLYNKMVNGERLPQFLREQFLQQGRRQFESAQTRQNAYGETYRGLAGQYHMDPSHITPDLSAGVRVQQAVPPPPVGTVEDGYRFNGGDPADPNNWTKVQ